MNRLEKLIIGGMICAGGLGFFGSYLNESYNSRLKEDFESGKIIVEIPKYKGILSKGEYGLSGRDIENDGKIDYVIMREDNFEYGDIYKIISKDNTKFNEAVKELKHKS